jgi:two-component system, sensor histidine kinase YesM
MFRKLIYIWTNLICKISIKRRVFFYFLIIVFLPACIITLSIYKISKASLTKKINSSIQVNLNSLEESLTQKFDLLDDVATSLYLNTDFVNILSDINYKDEYLGVLRDIRYQMSNFEIIEEMDRLDSILKNFNFIGATKTTIVPSLYILKRPQYDNFNHSKRIFCITNIQSRPWYLKLPYRTAYSVVGLNSVETSSGSMLSIMTAKRLYALRHKDISYAGLLTLDIGIDELLRILKKFKLSPNNTILIIDKSSTIILSDDSTILGKSLAHSHLNGKIELTEGFNQKSYISRINNLDTLVTSKNIKHLDWTIVSLYPTYELYSELTLFKRIISVVFLFSIGLGLLVSWILSNNISNPIKKLVNSMNTVTEGNFDIHIEYNRNDEFSYLIEKYKSMVAKIDELIQKLYVSELNKKEAELKALQAQINPHFLYNTLDSINLMALKARVPEISTMITALSDFFRYSLSRGKTIIPIKNERQQIDSYLQIQKIRFKERLDYSVKIPFELYNCLTIKLLLQPLVENSILHGMESNEGKLFILVTAAKTPAGLEIIVQDNGKGADVDELNKMLREGSSKVISSYGIRNVNDRIRQTFGNDYGLRYSKNEGRGISAIVSLPTVKNMVSRECVQNAKDVNC